MPASDSHLPSVYAATYNHLGIILWGKEQLKASLVQEMEWLERHPNLKLGWDHEAYTYDYLAEHDPEMLEEMKTGLTRFAGRLGVGSSTYGQPLSMFIDGESNVRQLTLALDATEKLLGYPMSVYLMSEHPFHAQLPQLLAGCGFKGAVLRTHFMMYGHNPEYDAPVGDWVGLDGTRIPALPTYRGQLRGSLSYNSIPGLTSTLDNRILTDAPSEACMLTLADFRREFGERIQPLIATRADDVRYREELIERHEQDPWMTWILLEEIFDLLPQPSVEFRAHPNEFKVRMPWGYCGNWMWNGCRRAEVAVLAAERLAAISGAVSGAVSPDALEKAWKNLLVAQHHDIQICGLEDDARQFLGECETQTALVRDTALDAISAYLEADEGILFNPLAWERMEWVESGRFKGLVKIPGLGFRTAAGPKTIDTPSTAENREDAIPIGEPEFTWQPVGRSDSLQVMVSQEAVGVLQTPFYEVCVPPSGGIRHLRDRRNGQILLSPPKTSGTLAGMINGMDTVSHGRVVDARIESGRAVLVEEGKIADIHYRSEWIFYIHTPRIDWRGEVDFGGQWIGRPKNPLPHNEYRFDRDDLAEQIVPGFNEHEYKLRLRFFPYLGPHVIGIRDLPFHIAETDQPYLQGLYWTAVTDGRVGLALINRGQMGSVRESDGAISSVLAFSLPYVWGTRVLNGKYNYELGILPFTGDWQAADLHRQAMEYNFPIQYWQKQLADERQKRIESSSQDQVRLWTPFSETVKGKAVLSAFFTRGGIYYARYAEYGGGEAEVAIEWVGKTVSFTAVDLREREQGSLGSLLKLGPWQVRTVRFE
jgi:hypothetical protein